MYLYPSKSKSIEIGRPKNKVKDGEAMRRCDVGVDHGEVMRGGETGRKWFLLEFHGVGVVLGFQLGPDKKGNQGCGVSFTSGEPVIQDRGGRAISLARRAMTFAGMNTARLGWAGNMSVRGRGTSLGLGEALAASRLSMVVPHFSCVDDSPVATCPSPKPIRHRLQDTKSKTRLTSTAARTAAPCHHRPSYPPKAELPLQLQLRSHPLLRFGWFAVELVWSGRRGLSAIRPSLRGRVRVRTR